MNVNHAAALGDGAAITDAAYIRTVNISGGTLDNTSGSAITVLNNRASTSQSNSFITHINGNFAFGGTNALQLNVGVGTGSGGGVAQRGYITLGDTTTGGGSRTITTDGTAPLTLNGAIVNGGGTSPTSSSLTKAGAGKLVLGQANFFTGGSTVNAGTLEINGGATAAQSSLNGARTVGGTTITGMASTANLRVGQAVSGPGIAAGTVISGILSGTSVAISLASTTAVAATAADLSFTAGSGLGLGTVTINNVGSTLAGNGGIAGLVTIGSGSILAPGSNSTGTLGNYGGTSTTLTLSGGLTLNAGAALNFDSGDRVNVSGGLFTINGGALTLNNGVTLNAPGTYTLFNYTGATLAGSVSNLTVANPLSGVTAAFSTDGSNNVLMTLTSGGLSNNADLSSLVVTTATLAPTFSSGTTSYTATVPYATSSVTVTPTVAQVAATVKVNGVTVTSGNASAPISLNVGSNVITTDVTAEDGTTIKSYTVTVTRQTHTIEDWRQLWYGTTSNTGNAADTASPYGTGISNLFVYAFLGLNQNPATAKASQLPQFALDATNLSFTFSEPSGVSGLTYGAEYRTDLVSGSWLPVTDTGSGTTHIFSVARGANTKLFLRLTVTSP